VLIKKFKVNYALWYKDHMVSGFADSTLQNDFDIELHYSIHPIYLVMLVVLVCSPKCPKASVGLDI